MRIFSNDRQLRWAVICFATLACFLYVAAYFFPLWGWYLQAPQYPNGLVMAVYLNKVTGDITEINILNHYIGMARLDEAAKLERALAVYGVSGIGLITMIGVFLPGKRYAKLFSLPAMLFPLVFLGATYFWMYKFGHQLNPDAPVDVAPFTPTLLGMGTIGNFHTLGMPGPGFYMILLSAAAVSAAFILRQRVCSGCTHAKTCGAVCPHLFIKSQPPVHSEKSIRGKNQNQESPK